MRVGQPPPNSALPQAAPGTEVKVLLADQWRGRYAQFQQLDGFEPNPKAIHALAGQSLGGPSTDGELGVFAAISPRGISRQRAQQLLDQPFEWRAFYGGSFSTAEVSRGDGGRRGHLTWLNETPEALAKRAQEALDAAGHSWLKVSPSAELSGFAAERTVPTLALQHPFASDHWQALNAFNSVWRKLDDTMPPLVLRGSLPASSEVQVTGFPTGTPETRSILERFGLLNPGRFQPNPAGITHREYEVLADWTKRVYGLDLPEHAAHRGLLALMTCRLRDLDDAAIDASLAAHVELGTLTPFSVEIFSKLRDQYRSHPPSRAHRVRLDTHLKLDSVPLLIFQQLFAPEGGVQISTSSYSGFPVMRRLAELNGIEVAVPPPKVSLSYVPAAATPAFPTPDKPALVAERAGSLLKKWSSHHSPAEIEQALRRGDLKIISHNASDDAKIAEIMGAKTNRRLNLTKLKQREARLIGARQLLQAAELSREHWQRPISDSQLVVVGAGLIGGGVVSEALELGFAPEQILVVDTDPAIRHRYQELGCQVMAQLEPRHGRPTSFERAILIHATDGSNLNMDNVFQFAEDTMVLSMTSGGRGVQWESTSPDLVRKYEDPIFLMPGSNGRARGTGTWWTGYDDGKARSHYNDVNLEHLGRKARIVAGGYPPNLLEEQWHDLFQLTSCLVAASVLHSMLDDNPNAPALPQSFDDEAAQLFEAHHGGKYPPFRGYSDEDWAKLRADFLPPD